MDNITRNHNDDASSSSSSSTKRIKTFSNGDVAPWSNATHDALFLVMMQLGFVDFFALSGVCKSWRSVALTNMNIFMASKPPISICDTSTEANEDGWCYFKDVEEKEFKTILPHFTRRICVGSTCGYLILFGRETHDLWLVNPITRHELHFPDYPSTIGFGRVKIRGVLVFSPSISSWVFVVLYEGISFCILGEPRWNHVSSTIPIDDLHFFKGKIYTLNTDCSLGELRLDLKENFKWTLIEYNKIPNPHLYSPLLVSSGENLYVIAPYSVPEKIVQLDFGEMKWVSRKKTIIGEYAFFMSWRNYSAAIKPESWLFRTQYQSLDTGKSRHYINCNYKRMWYFLHDCLNVNLLDE